MMGLLLIAEKMEPVFFHVLNMSFTASYVFCFVLICRQFIKKAPKIYSYVLWFAMLFRLLCPVALPSTLSLLNLLDLKGNQTVMEYISSDIGMAMHPTVDAGIPILSDLISNLLPAPDPNVLTSANPLQILTFIWCNLWLFGIYAFVIYTFISVGKIRRLTRTAVQVEPGVYESEFLMTPFARGVFRTGFMQTKIYLPTHLSKEERNVILAHERIHLRRLDPLVKGLFFVALMIHWFNPMVWVAFYLMIRDMEMSCDEAVLRETMGAAEYSEVLLKMASKDNTLNKSSLFRPLAFGESNVASRIKNVLHFDQISFRGKLLLTATCMVMLIACSCNPASKGTDLRIRIQYYWNQLTAGYQDTLDMLWNNRTPYVGDNSAIGKLLGALTVPQEPGLVSGGMELETTERPYRLIIYYHANASNAREMLEQNNDWIYENMAILFALIDNVDMIETRITFFDENMYCFASTRAQVIETLYGDLKHDLKIDTKEQLEDYVNRLKYKIVSVKHIQEWAYANAKLVGTIQSLEGYQGGIIVTGRKGKTNKEYTMEISLDHCMIYDSSGKRVWANFLDIGEKILIGYDGIEIDTLPGYIPKCFFIQILSE